MQRLPAVALGVLGVGACLGYTLLGTHLGRSQSGDPLAEFAGVSLRVEIATSTSARERGLGGRTELGADEAMLFVFATDDQYGFWMKDTLIPLDIFWLDAEGHVVHIEPDVETSSYPHVFYPSVPARYVLETRAGFARAHNVTLGAPLRLQNFPSVSK